MGKVVGIDLGTTYSAIAVVNDHGHAEILANREGERTTPSVVLFEGEGAIVGGLAKRSAVMSPLDVIQFVKRQMGVRSWKFRAANGSSYSAEEVSALILRRLKDDAEALLGEAISDAVITVPAYFDDAQRKATKDAGRIAGLNVRRIISEPTAAALAYGIERLEKSETIMVYDLGGGTFDVTIMRIGEGKIDVIATGGDKNLGGFDWDNCLIGYLNDQFKQQCQLDLQDDPTLEQDLRDKAEAAKRDLSTREKVTVFLSAGGKNAKIDVTLDKFNEITAHLTKRTGTIMKMVLDDADMTWDSIDKILLVGGSTRMRAVPRLIEAASGKVPSLELHPDEVVALGAAMQGAVLSARAGLAGATVSEQYGIIEIEDVVSHSLGVIALDDGGREFNSIIIQRNAKIPCTESEVYNTVVDNQTRIQINVTQGEEEDPAHVESIFEDVLKISPYPKGAPIRVAFHYDEDAILHVSVFDATANVDLGEIKIPRKRNLAEDQIASASTKMKAVTVA